MCVSVHGDQRTQLLRQLIAAALNMAAGDATFGDYGLCDSICQDSGASLSALSTCIDATDAFNQSGDHIPAPFDPPGPADSKPCSNAFNTDCTVLAPAPCAAP
jgi:hypothetical protein